MLVSSQWSGLEGHKISIPLTGSSSSLSQQERIYTTRSLMLVKNFMLTSRATVVVLRFTLFEVVYKGMILLAANHQTMNEICRRSEYSLIH